MSPDRLDRATRSYVMSRIRSKGTKCERALRAALVGRHIKGFKMHYDAFGQPDFAFPSQKVAIFCDSEFWHGLKPIPVSNRAYWGPKIARNVSRDRLVESKLRAEGWTVLRFRESRLLGSLAECVEEISARLHERSSGPIHLKG